MGRTLDRTGEKKIMNCGLEAEIICYRSADDIDVKFEDGYIAYNKSYSHFKNGKIKSRLNESNRLGEERLMNCGLKAKIIRYKNSQDIDVEFEDGYIRKHQCYCHFKNGKLESKKEYESRVGRSLVMKSGEKATIIRYGNAKDIDVEFDNGSIIYNTYYDSFKFGTLISPNTKTVLGIGYLGNSKSIDENGITKKAYTSWLNMLKRCYDDFCLKKHPTYKKAEVCDEWKCFANFEKWFNENYYEIEGQRMNLDKDILKKGNKIYSPDTCVYTPQKINTLFVKSDALRGKLPIGVTKNGKNGYSATCCTHSGINDKIESKVGEYLGTFRTPEEAFYAYKTFKETYIKQIAEEYKPYIPQKLYEAMYKYEIEITD